MEHSMMSKEVGCPVHLTLPTKGLSEEEIMESLHKYVVFHFFMGSRDIKKRDN
jgi:hypothetical protein